MNRSAQRGGMGRPTGGSVTAIPVSVDTATIMPISARITTTTTLEAEKNVEVIAKVSGVVKSISVEEGQTVKAGQALARIDDEEIKIQVMEARARTENAASVYNRSKDIFEQNLISREEFENSRYQRDIAQTQLETAELRLKYTTIRAPFAGMVTERLIDLGSYVTVNSMVYRMADYDPILARVRIPEKEIGRISLGQAALVEVEAAPGRQFEGQVDMISPIVDPTSGTVKVTIKIHQRDRILSPGMFAQVFIVTDTRPNALVISKKALILEGDVDYVYLLEDGVAYRRQITRGFEESNQAEIIDGLKIGDRVITVGAGGLRDGMAVYVPGEAGPALADVGTPASAAMGRNPQARGGARASGGMGNRPGGAMGEGFTPDPERMKRMEARFLSDPKIKAAYEKKLKQDPELAKDPRKKMAFFREQMGWDDGAGRPPEGMGGPSREEGRSPRMNHPAPASAAPPERDRSQSARSGSFEPVRRKAPAEQTERLAFDEERLKKFEASLLADPSIKESYDRKLREDPALGDDIQGRVAFLRELLRQRAGSPR
ncbi:efflux RND transporter periplasmic adaptor subunit [candidate division KSB1 bacterium]